MFHLNYIALSCENKTTYNMNETTKSCKDREKYLKAKILSYLAIIEDDSKKKKKLLLFLEKNGMSRSTWYAHVSKNLKLLNGYKLEGIAIIIDRYEQLQAIQDAVL